jgi:hypothetical protein
MRAVAVLLALVTFHLVPGVRAAMAADDAQARAEARERFDRGLRLFEEGDNGGALAEFKRAYELVPNPLVLFNIGLVYAALGRPVEATDALDQVLRDPGRLPADRLPLARRTRQEQAARIAQVAVSASVPALIDVDGIEAGRTPLPAPLRVAGGTHVIGALAAGHLPLRREITIAGGETKELAFELTPTEARLAHLALDCAIPDAEVLVDGTLVGRTPLAASLAVAPGTRVVSVRRKGYREARRELVLAEGATGKLDIELEEDPGAPPADRGQLALVVSETEAHVAVDGRARGVYSAPLTLPAGAHRLRLQRAGFEPIERDVVLRAGAETSVRMTLVPTPETRLAYVERVQARKRWGSLALGGGLALALAGGALAIWSQRSLPELEDRVDRAVDDYMFGSKGECDPAVFGDNDEMRAICRARVDEADSQLSNRKVMRNISAVGAGVGVAAVAVGVYLLLTNDDPKRYDRSAGPALTFVPSPWIDRSGAGAALTVRF